PDRPPAASKARTLDFAAPIPPALNAPPPLTAPAARLLPLLFWLLGSFFYFGDLGKWTDDYAFTEVDPITGRAETLWRDGEWILWRPLMLKVNSFLQTVLWEHDRALHLIGASIHAAAAFLLWRFALSLGFGRLVAAFMGLLFLTYPG